MLLLLALVWLGTTLGLRQGYRRGHLKHDFHNDAVALGLLALATVGFFWRLLLTSDVWMPAGGGDLASFLYPVYRFAAQSIKAGDLPLWNPYLYGGASLAGDNQSGLFYPFNLALSFLLPAVDYRAMELMAVAHFYLAGICAYFGLRYISRKPLRWWAAMGGAAAFMFSDLFVTHLGNLNMIAAAAWLPLVFCLFRRALDEKRISWAIGASVFLGVAALAGHIQPLLYIILTLGLYFLYHVYGQWKSGLGALLRAVSLASLTMIVAFGVAAPALLPNYEMSRLTLRGELTYEQASQYSLPPVALVGLLVPGVFGRGPAGFWGPWPRVEVGYVGILPLLLAGLALLMRRDSLTRFLAILGVISLFLALGDSSVLYGWLYRLVPGFDMLRAPARFSYVLDFALAALAALGLDVVLRPIERRARSTWRQVLHVSPFLWFGAAAVALPLGYATLMYSQDKPGEVFARLLGGLSGVVFALVLLGLGVALLHLRGHRRARHHALGLAFFLLIVFDLASLGAHTELEYNDPTVGFEHPAAIAFLKNDSDFYRIDTRTGVWDVWQPDLSLMHNIFDVWGIYNPLVLADFDRYWEGLGSRSTPLYDFLNTKYIVGHKDVVLDWEKFELAFDADPKVNIYRNTRVLPRAFVVHEAWSAMDHEQAFAAIQRADFAPASVVVIEGEGALDPQMGATSEARIVSYSNGEIEVQVSASQPGYLVLSEVYYPGWRVEVDGSPAELKRANYAFRAVSVPVGAHRVRFYFRSTTWMLGMACSLVTWTILALAAARALATGVRYGAWRGGP